MTPEQELQALAGALPRFSPVLKHMNHSPVLHLTLYVSDGQVEGVDVYPADTVAPNFWAVRAVCVDTERTDTFPIAVVYGLGLIPAIVNEFSAIRKRQNA